MHLEDVTIEGFKSFSEQTAMGFQPGIGVIIGNNGVGKSNILDAIVWALGEDDLDRLRCYEPGELFFSGSKAYPPAERAKVDLTVRRNADKNSPLVRFSRAVDRDGGRHYWVENQAVDPDRFRRELEPFGLLDALKTIIRQEEINDILQMPPDRRFSAVRQLLEMPSEAELEPLVREQIAPLFSRHFACLLPLAEGRLQVVSHNGRKGLEVEVTLPGNRLRRAHQLSGGEKSIASLALKLAVFRLLDSPFFLLDEVEPSLDYTNHKSIQAFLKEVAAHKQLIMITHLRTTIELADTLHGVRTRFDGSSFMKFYFVMDKRLLRLYKCC